MTGQLSNIIGAVVELEEGAGERALGQLELAEQLCTAVLQRLKGADLNPKLLALTQKRHGLLEQCFGAAELLGGHRNAGDIQCRSNGGTAVALAQQLSHCNLVKVHGADAAAVHQLLGGALNAGAVGGDYRHYLLVIALRHH